MKNIYLTTIAFLTWISSFGQWNSQASGTVNNLNSVYFTDLSNGYAAGANGTIIKTTDGGSSWSALSSGTVIPLHSIFFADPNTGFAAGDSGLIIKTTDAGATWTTLTSGVSNTLTSVFFTDVNNGFVCGSSGKIIHTTNGGATWTNQTTPTIYMLQSIFFTNSVAGYAVGLAGTAISYNGTSWATASSGSGMNLNSVFFADTSNAFIVGDSGTVLKSTNGGVSWTSKAGGTGNNLYSVCFANASVGYAVGGNGTIIKTTDGGNTWTTLTSGSGAQLNSVSFKDANNGWVAGQGGNLLKTVNGGVSAPVPVAGFTYSGTCTGSVTSFTDVSSNSPTSWNWNFTGGTPATSTLQNPSVTFNTSGTHAVYLIATNANGSDTLVQSITISGVVATIGSQSPATCGSCNGSATANATGGGGVYTYLWSNSQTSVSVSALCAGTYTVTITDSSGCSSTANATITNVGGPTVSTSVTNVSCFGGSNGSATATASGGTGAYTYNWQPGGITTVTATGLAAGTYTVNVTDANGCVNSAIATITQPAPININAGADQTICAGASATLTASGAFTYMWSTGATTTSINASPAFTTNYWVTGTDTSGCSATDTVLVIVNPGVVVNAGPDQIACADSAMFFLSGNSSTGSGIWSTSGTGTFNPNSTSLSTSYAAGTADIISGTVTLVLTSTNNGSCSGSSDTLFLIINPKPAVNAGADISICSGQSVALSATGAIAYNWSNGSTLPSQNITPGVTTAFSVTGTDANGCTATDSIIVTVNTNPTIAVTASNANICAGFSSTLTAVGAAVYSWSTGANTFSITVSPVVTTQYTVTGTDVNGCVDSSMVSITVGANKDITGQITYSGGNVTSGNVFLIAQGASSAWFDTVATAAINTSGMYTFTTPAAGSYYLRAEAAPSTLFVNTYFSHQYLWDSAQVLSHGCVQNDTANILMIELPTLSGPGSISGVVYEGAGYGQKIIPGNPVPFANVIPGVPVKVGRNPSGTIVASTTTDSTGAYHFTNLPVDDYRIYTDIPGYPMDSSYVVSITTTQGNATNLNYVVDSNSVSVLVNGVGIQEENINSSVYNVFPNPTNGLVNIQFPVNSIEVIRLFDLSGRLIYTSTDQRTGNTFKANTVFHLDMNELGLSTGTYLLDLQNAGKKFKINYVRN